LGSLIQPGQPLMSIQSNRRLVAELNVFERDLAVLRTGLGGELRLTQGGGQIPVKITGIGGVMNPDTRAVPVYAEPSQALPANWVAGVSVLAALDAGQQQAAVVPEGALTQQGSDQVLFLSADGLAFTPVVVTTGASADGLTEIVSPDLSALLINGRKVVVAGAFYVLSHQAVSEGGEE
jgi:cobalt-zinc-cadmium efflux system membrane fusion protein